MFWIWFILSHGQYICMCDIPDSIIILLFVIIPFGMVVDLSQPEEVTAAGTITGMQISDPFYIYTVTVPDGRIIVKSVNWYDLGSEHNVKYMRTGYLHLPYSDGEFLP